MTDDRRTADATPTPAGEFLVRKFEEAVERATDKATVAYDPTAGRLVPVGEAIGLRRDARIVAYQSPGVPEPTEADLRRARAWLHEQSETLPKYEPEVRSLATLIAAVRIEAIHDHAADKASYAAETEAGREASGLLDALHDSIPRPSDALPFRVGDPVRIRPEAYWCAEDARGVYGVVSQVGRVSIEVDAPNFKAWFDPESVENLRSAEATPPSEVIGLGDFVRIHNGGGRGRIVRGPCYLVESDQGGNQIVDACQLEKLGRNDQ